MHAIMENVLVTLCIAGVLLSVYFAHRAEK
jgi:hypothetical protein